VNPVTAVVVANLVGLYFGIRIGLAMGRHEDDS
jgi:hypothetical protein